MSIVRDALIEEIKESIKLSKKYSDIIKTAKTQTKRKIYKQKLEKNNIKLSDFIIALDKLDSK